MCKKAFCLKQKHDNQGIRSVCFQGDIYSRLDSLTSVCMQKDYVVVTLCDCIPFVNYVRYNQHYINFQMTNCLCES